MPLLSLLLDQSRPGTPYGNAFVKDRFASHISYLYFGVYYLGRGTQSIEMIERWNENLHLEFDLT